MIEWYFLVSLLTGPFDPQTELGWANVERLTFSAPSQAACELFRDGYVQELRERMKGGEGAVVTGCQPRTKP